MYYFFQTHGLFLQYYSIYIVCLLFFHFHLFPVYIRILFGEYKCHKESKVAGLTCLYFYLFSVNIHLLIYVQSTSVIKRARWRGWIAFATNSPETSCSSGQLRLSTCFTKRSQYKRLRTNWQNWTIIQTWYGKRILPMFYTLPLIYSYFSFIYDNYSDVLLSYNYYQASYDDNHTTLETNNSSCSSLLLSDGQVCIVPVALL